MATSNSIENINIKNLLETLKKNEKLRINAFWDYSGLSISPERYQYFVQKPIFFHDMLSKAEKNTYKNYKSFLDDVSEFFKNVVAFNIRKDHQEMEVVLDFQMIVSEIVRIVQGLAPDKKIVIPTPEFPEVFHRKQMTNNDSKTPSKMSEPENDLTNKKRRGRPPGSKKKIVLCKFHEVYFLATKPTVLSLKPIKKEFEMNEKNVDNQQNEIVELYKDESASKKRRTSFVNCTIYSNSVDQLTNSAGPSYENCNIYLN